MKYIFTYILIIFCSITAVKAQIKKAVWASFGAEIRNGHYSGTNSVYIADNYSIVNGISFLFDGTGPESMNVLWDMSGLFNFGNRAGQSDYTFRNVWDRPLFRLCLYKLKGDESSNTRFGIGGQMNWRTYGVGEKIGAVHSEGYQHFRAGPMTAKSRFGIGPNIHLAHQFHPNVYSRLSLYADVEPGSKLNGISVYPEAVVIANVGLFALRGNLSYRYSYFTGDSNIGKYIIDTKRSATSGTLMYGLSLCMNFERWM